MTIAGFGRKDFVDDGDDGRAVVSNMMIPPLDRESHFFFAIAKPSREDLGWLG